MTLMFWRGLAAFGAGAFFGAGLIVSGMTQPRRVLGFLDLFGAWDPSLLFVMMGAIGVHFFAYRMIRSRSRPLAAEAFAVPARRPIDAKLLLGAGVFGIGWGLGGYCPGPSIVSLASGSLQVLVFVLAYALGTFFTLHSERFASRAFGRSLPVRDPPTRGAATQD